MKRARGYTLMEIMVVVLLLGLLMSVAVPSLLDLMVQEERKIAHTQAVQLASQVETFRLLHGRYPTEGEGLDALVAPVRHGVPVLKKLPRDPWREKYLYARPGVRNPDLDVWSKGPDRQDRTHDDVGNWDLEDG
jgi:general secretion pathway protein G